MKKLFFVHVPKTAGNSVRQAMRNKNLLTNPGYEKKEREHHFAKKNAKRIVGQHLSFKTPFFPSYSELKAYKEADFSFSIIRNPYDVLVSYYSHYIDNSKKKNWIDNGWANVNGYHGFSCFDEFIEYYCTCESEDWHIPNLNKNLFCQLYNETNQSIVDYAIYFDDLENNLNFFLEKVLKVNSSVRLEKKNVSSLKKVSYEEYYNDYTKKLVSKKCQKLLEAFNFNFGKKSTNKIKLIKGLKYE